MDTNKKIREHISALSDGELSASDIELAFAALHAEDGHQAWEVYHRIGDVLRSQPSPDLSPGFSSRLKVRLAAEPAYGTREVPVLAEQDPQGDGGTVAQVAGPRTAATAKSR